MQSVEPDRVDRAEPAKLSRDAGLTLTAASSLALAACGGGGAGSSNDQPPTISGQDAARIVAANRTLGARRQVFFVSLNGFDTSDHFTTTHPALTNTLGQAIDQLSPSPGTWMGASASQVSAAFPNIGNFGNVPLALFA